MTHWAGGFVKWIKGDTVFLSVVFSWQLKEAKESAIYWLSKGYEVYVGGVAFSYNPSYFSGINIKTLEGFSAIKRHNPEATFTSRGCVRKCSFCIVSKIEPEYIELNDWDIRPIVCDNNLLASSKKHFNSVIDKLKSLKGVDFNQGLDARLMSQERANRLAELNLKCVRLAWDHIGMEKAYLSAFDMLIKTGIPSKKIHTYVLIGYDDNPDDALYRLEIVKKLGAWTNPMRYQPLDAKKRNDYISPNWTEQQLKDYMRYWSKQIWLWNVPFNEYQSNYKKEH